MKRDNTIDVIKGIGIVLVIIGHISFGQNIIYKATKQYIYSFHMPLFFLVSGILMNIESFNSIRQFIKKKMKTIIVPYLFFSLISFLVYVIVFDYSTINDIKHGFIKQIFMCLLGIRSISQYIFTGALWFLPCLFISEIIIFLLINEFKFNNLKFTVTILLISLIGNIYSRTFNLPLLMNLDVAFNAMLFIGLGYLIRINNKKEVIYTIKLKWIFILFIISLMCTAINGRIDMFSGTYGKSVIIFWIGAISGILFICSIAYKLKNISFFRFIGKNSLIIFATHQQLIIHPLNCIFKNSISTRFNSSLLGIFYLCVVFIFSTILIFFINKYIPIVIGDKRVNL